MLKTEAVQRNVAYLCQDEDTGYDIRPHAAHFPGPYSPICFTPILIVAVDDLPTRERIWNLLRAERAAFAERGEDHPVQLLIDVRSGLDVVLAYTVDLSVPNPDTSIYDESFTRADADVPCSGRAVAYNSFAVASIAGRMVAAYANGDYIPRHVSIDHKIFFYFVE